jgi:hypothetical protein
MLGNISVVGYQFTVRWGTFSAGWYKPIFVFEPICFTLQLSKITL